MKLILGLALFAVLLAGRVPTEVTPKGIMEHSAGLRQLNEAQIKIADMNGDGRINVADAILLLREIEIKP